MLNYIKNLFKKKQTAKSMQDSKEPWVNVVKAHVDPANPKSGYFELEWNPAFVMFLISNGYAGPTAEDIVDQWFSELCRNVGADENIDMKGRDSGYVNRALRDDGKTEIS